MRVITIGSKKAAGKTSTMKILTEHWEKKGFIVTDLSGSSTIAGFKQTMKINEPDILIVDEIGQSKRCISIKDLEDFESDTIAYVTITN